MMMMMMMMIPCSCSRRPLLLNASKHHHSQIPIEFPSIPIINNKNKKTHRKHKLTSFSRLHDSPSPSPSGYALNAVEVDPMLEIKKKAMDVTPGLKGTSIFLVGINSSMKTRLGKLLAEALRYYFFDSDLLVVEAAGGEAAAKQFLDADEIGFRESETEVLKQLSSMGRLVVAAGDGAVQSTNNLALLRHGISVWVEVPLDMVAKEVVEDGVQHLGLEMPTSLSQSEVLSLVTTRYQEMREGYAVADATVSVQRVASQMGYDDIEAVTTEDMGLEVLTEIEKLVRVKKMMEDAARPF